MRLHVVATALGAQRALVPQRDTVLRLEHALDAVLEADHLRAGSGAEVHAARHTLDGGDQSVLGGDGAARQGQVGVLADADNQVHLSLGKQERYDGN